ncbi:MAG: bifunctional phosphopantothenoylcysteine decarboxylase/phosphopantothenate--cysteine ligase CoaBC [Flavobacteriaceae bacterium]|nr:bifunctional phosphopantothenoylcysteine decarboxylase/phosphopantothenate--cysteine ligase CoaBC [Flavobacteriaceae bacterium]
MSLLNRKKLLIAITGGIAGYKIKQLVRDFVKNGAEIQVILTPSAKDFVSPLTLSTLSKKPVYSDFFNSNGEWNSHIDLALWADVMLIAPCTANTLGKMVNGICDNLVIATYLSAKCPIFIAPAMDLDMYAHPSTKRNLTLAESYGHRIIPAESGELASGLVGEGRLAEIDTIFNQIVGFFQQEERKKSLSGKTILITAGPTHEAIDPVRFIGNHSSGKMGFAIAEEAQKRGAKVILVSGPTSLTANSDIHLEKITSAKEMFDQVFQHYHQADIAIMSAAVADYTPKVVAQEKIKKNDEEITLTLTKNPDILKTMGEQKKNQFLVGFALETQNEEENAKAKLERKNLDMIVLNSLKDNGAGFQHSTNKIKIITPKEQKDFPLKSKEEVAKDILNFIEEKLNL